MIKVLMCGNHPSNKGGMTSVINQIREHDWASDGIELDFIPTYMPGNPIKKALFFAASYIKIAAKLAFDKPDVVHMHMSYRGSFTRKYLIHKLCQAFHVKDIIHLHGIKLDEWYQSLPEAKKEKVQALFSECERIIVLGKASEKIVHSIEKSAKTVIVENCVQIPDTMAVWNDNKIEVLYLGVLIPLKGVSDLLKTIKMLVDREQIGKLHFTIAGTGIEESALKAQANDLGIQKYITFAGWVSGKQKETVLKQSQLTVLPSYSEGLPVSLLEAMSYGMPVVSTNVGDIPSLIKHCENGMLFSPGDTKAMEECLLYLTNEESYAKLAENARKTVVEHYSLELFLLKLKGLYEKLSHPA